MTHDNINIENKNLIDCEIEKYLDWVDKALVQFINNDNFLKENFSERAKCFRIGHYLANTIEKQTLSSDGIVVDCEYNRCEYESKKLSEDYNRELEKFGYRYNSSLHVVPDIIVHKRGEKENYIVIEAKNNCWDYKDKAKVKTFVECNDYLYKVGILLNFKQINSIDESFYMCYIKQNSEFYWFSHQLEDKNDCKNKLQINFYNNSEIMV